MATLKVQSGSQVTSSSIVGSSGTSAGNTHQSSVITNQGPPSSSSRHHSRHSHSHRHHRPKHAVHWFRKGLRLSDNPALRRAMTNSDSWRCVFILDPWFAGCSNQGVNKWRFLLQCLDDLDQGLRKLHSRLYVVRGQPLDALPNLFKRWKITYLSFEEDPEPFGKVRDENIKAMCKEMGVKVVTEKSHTLYDLDRIIDKNDGKAPATYRQFINMISTMRPPPVPVPHVSVKIKNYGVSPISDDHDDLWGVPSLNELGFDTDNMPAPKWIGGETEALNRLDRHLERKAWVASFAKPKMTPQSLYASPCGLSPYLRFGCLSTKQFYHLLGDLYRKIKEDPPPMSTFGQLLWREFFYTAATKNPNFDKMLGNPICVQIPWDDNPGALAKWASGRTGFPWIDAIMTQLREEGWIHHLARHSVACFLTRGHLWISWEDGMKVFDELLLDADWSVNAGTWMWLSCSSFFTQFFPVYDPVKFGRKVDPNGDYIRKYVPVLKNYPIQYIHEPWIAPEQVQKAARCVVGVDYPKPMVDHEMAAKQNQERMKQVYQQLSTYQYVKSPEGPASASSSSTSVNNETNSVNKQQQQVPTASNVASSSGTFVTSSKYNSNTSLTQVDTELMPAPMPVNSGQSQQQHHHHHHQQQQHHHQNQNQINPQRQPQRTHFPSGSNVEEKAFDIDDLTPSINNYQPGVVSATLQCDATNEYQKQYLDQTRIENTNELDQFLDIGNSTTNEETKK